MSDLSLQLAKIRTVIANLTPRIDPGQQFVLAPDDRPLNQAPRLEERWFEVDAPASGGQTQRVFGADQEQVLAQITVSVLYDAKRAFNDRRDRMASDRDLIRAALQSSVNYASNVQLMTFRTSQDSVDSKAPEFVRRTLVFDCLYLAELS